MARLQEENGDLKELLGHAKEEAEEAEAEREALGVELEDARRHLGGLCARVEGLQVCVGIWGRGVGFQGQIRKKWAHV